MATTATIEKVVRKVLDEELSETKEATLKAIQKVGRLLAEQVIPNLPDEDQTEAEPADEATVAGNGESRAMSRRAATPEVDADEELPEDDEGEPASEPVPARVSETFEQMYGTLTAPQAKALAAMFTAISNEPHSEEA